MTMDAIKKPVEKIKKKVEKLKNTRSDAVIKRLDLPKIDTKGRKLLIIQIDSMPYPLLKKYLDKGAFRFLRRLLKKKGYHLQEYNCGIPTGTPAVQAGILYGDNSMIPGFRFMDKKSGEIISFSNPTSSRRFEEKWFNNKKGILEDGAAFCNVFSGGAEHSIFTITTVTKTKRLKRLKESSLWLFLLLYPKSLWRVIYYSTAELLIGSLEVILHPIRKLLNKRTLFTLKRPFRRAFINAIITEITTLGTIIDIKRGVPRVMVNYLNFDEVGHYTGPDSAAAYFAMRAIDRRLRRIWKKAKGKYDIFILSDHGQSPGMPFEISNGMNLAGYIEKCTNMKSVELSEGSETRTSLHNIIVRKIISFLETVSAPLQWMGIAAAKNLIRQNPSHLPKGAEKENMIIIQDSCSMAHVYFTEKKHRMNSEEITKKHPGLIWKLAAHKDIGIVMVKENDGFSLYSEEGTMNIGKIIKIKGKEFLHKYGDRDLLLGQLREFNEKKFLGDLVIFTSATDGVFASFSNHVGSHGGIGGDMGRAFFMSKKKFNLRNVTNASQLHNIFTKYLEPDKKRDSKES